MMPTDSLKVRVLEAARNSPSPTRRQVTRRSVLVLVASWAITLCIFWALGGVRPTHRPLALIAGTAASALGIALLVAWGAWGRGRSMVGRPRPVLAFVIALAPIALLATKLAWSARFPDGLAEWPTRAGFKCLGVCLSTGILPLVAAVYARRFSDPMHPVLSGAALGAAAGAFAAFLVDLWCPVAYLPHLLLGHVLPLVLLTVVGAVLGRFVLRVRPAPGG